MARVLYALLISVSLVMNLLLVIAVLRCRAKVGVNYSTKYLKGYCKVDTYTYFTVNLIVILVSGNFERNFDCYGKMC